MKVYFSPASPFVRKVLASAIELGLEDRIERLPSAAHPVNRDAQIAGANPLGQVPTLFTDDGAPLHDSRVICEYLDALAGGGRLFPAAGPARWQALLEQSLGDGLLDAALLARYEAVARPQDRQWDEWTAAQMRKIDGALDRFVEWLPGFGDPESGGRVDIGTLTVGCALGYLDFRFPHHPWREGRPALADWFAAFGRRPSMARTVPHA